MALAVVMREVDVDSMLKRITPKKFMEWYVYNNMEPFTHTWDDLKTASIVQAIRNVLVQDEKHLAKLDDCVLRVDENAPRRKKPETLSERVAAVAQTVEEQIMIARIMAKIQAQLQKEKSPDR